MTRLLLILSALCLITTAAGAAPPALEKGSRRAERLTVDWANRAPRLPEGTPLEITEPRRFSVVFSDRSTRPVTIKAVSPEGELTVRFDGARADLVYAPRHVRAIHSAGQVYKFDAEAKQYRITGPRTPH